MKKILCLLSVIYLFASCKKDEGQLPEASRYKYHIPQVKLTSDASVGAYYFNYLASDWAKVHSDTSLLGKPYNATAAGVMSQQLTWADEGGLDYLVFKWNASAADETLLKTFVTSRTDQHVKMVIGYNTAHLGATNASPLTGAKLQKMVDEFKTLAGNHLSKSYYYTIDNRPVILLTPLNLSSSATTSINFKAVCTTLRDELNKIGVNPFIIGELTTGWTAPVNFNKDDLGAMDAVVLTSWNTADYDRWWAFHSYSDLSWSNWKSSLAAMNVEFVPCIFPGYNEASSATQRVFERTEQNFVDYSNVAKRNMGKHQMVLINSWNDFTKGTALEPSKKFAKTFLDLTKREFKVSK